MGGGHGHPLWSRHWAPDYYFYFMGRSFVDGRQPQGRVALRKAPVYWSSNKVCREAKTRVILYPSLDSYNFGKYKLVRIQLGDDLIPQMKHPLIARKYLVSGLDNIITLHYIAAQNRIIYVSLLHINPNLRTWYLK